MGANFVIQCFVPNAEICCWEKSFVHFHAIMLFLRYFLNVIIYMYVKFRLLLGSIYSLFNY